MSGTGTGTGVTWSIEGALATVRLSREHGNAIHDGLVRALASACREIARDDRVRGALLAADGKLFCPGLDLRELLEYDRPAMSAFMGRFSECVVALYELAKPVVAALHSHALAGGSVLALTADRRILARGALVGLNEVRVGVPLPYGVACLLRASVPPNRLAEVALEGRNYEGEEAVAAGLADEIAEPQGFEALCRERLAELASKDPVAFRTTKRYLRSDTVAAMRAGEATHAAEFLDCWFREATQERIRAIVAELGSR